MLLSSRRLGYISWARLLLSAALWKRKRDRDRASSAWSRAPCGGIRSESGIMWRQKGEEWAILSSEYPVYI